MPSAASRLHATSLPSTRHPRLTYRVVSSSLSSRSVRIIRASMRFSTRWNKTTSGAPRPPQDPRWRIHHAASHCVQSTGEGLMACNVAHMPPSEPSAALTQPRSSGKSVKPSSSLSTPSAQLGATCGSVSPGRRRLHSLGPQDNRPAIPASSRRCCMQAHCSGLPCPHRLPQNSLGRGGMMMPSPSSSRPFEHTGRVGCVLSRGSATLLQPGSLKSTRPSLSSSSPFAH